MESSAEGLDRESINREVFGGGFKSSQIEQVVNEVVGQGVYEVLVQQTGGRPRQVLTRVNAGETAVSVESPLSTVSTITPKNIKDLVNSTGYTYTEQKPLGLSPKALIGPAGHFVENFAPITEAHPVGLLLHYLVSFGNQIGKTAYITVDGHDHFCSLFVALCGRSARGRKGTAGRRFEQVFNEAVPSYDGLYLNGLSTGEGIIARVADDAPSEDGGGT